MIPFGPKWMKAGSVRVRYYDEGEGDAVLLLHGLGGFAEHWQKNIGPISSHFRVIAPDIVGFGFTDKPSVDYTLRYFSEFVRVFADGLGLGRLAVVGSSLGGGIAVLCSLLNPGRVTKLVLVGSAGLTDWSQDWGMSGRAGRLVRRLLVSIAEAIDLKPSRWLLAFAYRRVVHRYSAECAELVDLHYEMSRSENAQRVFHQVSHRLIDPEASGGDFQLSEILGDVEVPTLLITGRRDRVIPPSQSVEAQKLLPRATLVELEECGHMPYFEKPVEFNKIVIDFLRS